MNSVSLSAHQLAFTTARDFTVKWHMRMSQHPPEAFLFLLGVRLLDIDLITVALPEQKVYSW